MNADPTRRARLIVEVGEALTQAVSDHEANGGVTLDRADRRVLAEGLLSKALDRERADRIREGAPVDTPDEERVLAQAVLNSMFGLGYLQDLIDDPQNQDIFINGHDCVQVIRRDGTKRECEPVAGSDQELIDMIQAAARPSGSGGIHEKQWTPSSPDLDLNLPSGDRLHAVAWVCRRPTVTIRLHNFDLYRLKQLLPATLSPALYAFLSAAVAAKLNILIAGSTNAGKTTLLRCLLNEVDPSERLITIEDSFELGLSQFPDRHRDLTEMEQRDPNSEGEGAYPMDRLVRQSLRMAPDRVIVGEIRGPEVHPMLKAMTQGNDGSMCTIHADSSAEVFSRLAQYVLEMGSGLDLPFVALLAGNALDLIVHIARLPDGSRVISSIREVTGTNDDQTGIATNEIFAPDPTGRGTFHIAPSARLLDKLEHAGLDRAWLSMERGGWAGGSP